MAIHVTIYKYDGVDYFGTEEYHLPKGTADDIVESAQTWFDVVVDDRAREVGTNNTRKMHCSGYTREHDASIIQTTEVHEESGAFLTIIRIYD